MGVDSKGSGGLPHLADLKRFFGWPPKITSCLASPLEKENDVCVANGASLIPLASPLGMLLLKKDTTSNRLVHCAKKKTKHSISFKECEVYTNMETT